MAEALHCTCGGGGAGFTNLGEGTTHEWWVCARCHKPAKQWWEAQEQMLNFFRGGPIDGYAYETAVLLSHDALTIPSLERYRWTPEIVVSQKTGARARVWVFDGAQTEPAQPEFVPEGNQYLTRRKALKLSRGELAELSGVNTSQITRLEVGMPIKAGTEQQIEQILAKLEADRNPR